WLTRSHTAAAPPSPAPPSLPVPPPPPHSWLLLQPAAHTLAVQYCPDGQLSFCERHATQALVRVSQRGLLAFLQSPSMRQATHAPAGTLHTMPLGHCGCAPLQPVVQ